MADTRLEYRVTWSPEAGACVATTRTHPTLQGVGATPAEALAELVELVERAVDPGGARTYLEETLGPRLTAFIAGDDRVQERLGAAAEIVRLLAEHDDAAVVRAWFIGTVPDLDLSPAELIAAGRTREAAAAARSFATNG